MVKRGVPLVLSFELLEDVMDLTPEESERHVGQAAVVRIGPVVEYAYYDYGRAVARLSDLAAAPAAAAFAAALASPGPGRGAGSPSVRPRAVEFCRAPRDPEETDDPAWAAFLIRMERAGVRAGLARTFAQALVGTCGEMADNVLLHSGSPGTGLVGYRWAAREFEYVVADAGVGVLESLRTNPRYSWLADSGQALETAVADGETRYGSGSGHGLGFSDLTHNIASRGSYLRFRSGDHAHVLDGTRARMERRTLPCAPFGGFLISVVCRPPRLRGLSAGS